MQYEGVLKIFQRSEENYSVNHVQYFGDGDSKGFMTVVQAKP